MRSLGVLVLGCFGAGGFGAGCFGDRDVNLSAIEVALVAASSIGHAASRANAAMDAPTACVAATQPCAAAYPCSGVALVTLGEGCPLPLGGIGMGEIGVSGSWSATDAATLGLSFGIGVAEGSVSVSEAVGVKVDRGNGHSTIAYSGQNVSVSAGATLAAQSAWTVDVDEKATPSDPADDVYTVDGAQQGASSGTISVAQVSLTGVILDPSCRDNPIAGMGVIQQVGSSNLGQDFVSFHAACDGKVDVHGTLGGNHAQRLVLFRQQ